MRVSQAVFGVFHHFELARELDRRGHLDTVYSTWPWARLKREGLPHSKVQTFPWLHMPEMVLNRAGLLPRWLEDELGYRNALSFDEWTFRRIRDCDALIAISGAALKTGRLVQERGGVFVCDRGSTHQRYQDEILAEEYRRWDVPYPAPAAHIVRREEAIYAIADAITVPSNVVRRSFLAQGLAEEKIHVIPYGVRLDKFKPTGTPPTVSFEVLFAGQISLRKGIPYLLEAFARLRHPRKHLTLAGSMQDDVRHLLAKLPTEHVTFLGAITQTELAERMSRSHVLALASVEEGLALVQGQAMACGCPIVATNATGAEDLFSDGVEGFIVPDRNSTVFAERLQQLADDPALRQRMSDAGLKRVKTLGGWDQYGAQWDALLHLLTRCPNDPS